MAKKSNTILALHLVVDSSWNGVISPFEWLNTSVFVVLESVFGRYPDTTFGNQGSSFFECCLRWVSANGARPYLL